MKASVCFDIFEQCALAIHAGKLIESLSARDKEGSSVLCVGKGHGRAAAG